MWWNSVNLATVPISPRPRWVGRAPKWHSTVKRLPIDKNGPTISPLSLLKPQKLEAAKDGKSLAELRPSCVGSYQNTGVQPSVSRRRAGSVGYVRPDAPWKLNDKRASSAPANRRPKSAPSSFGGTGGTVARSRPVSAAKRPQSASSAGMGDPTKPRRPQSAPSMLRSFDGQRQMRMAHEDGFLQQLETSAVKNSMEVFKHDKLICKNKVDGIDAMTDTSLYDLKVLHNGAQRAKARPESAGAEKAGDSADPSAKLPPDKIAVAKIRRLCNQMMADLRKNASRLCPKSIEPHALEYFKEYMEPIEDEETRNKRLRRELLAGFGGMFNKVAKDTWNDEAEQVDTVETPAAPPEPVEPIPAQPAATPQLPPGAQRAATSRLAELVGFLLGCCGNIDSVFNHFDANNDKVLSLQEWEGGMQKLGFQDDVSYVFRLLGKGPDGEATLNEVESLFSPFLKGKSVH